MADFIYCGTGRYVNATGTQQLLLGEFNAIWYPPDSRLTISQHDRVWLVWGPASPVLLGGGRVAADPTGNVLWTDNTLPGVAKAAQSLGYPGPPTMDFLKLTRVVSPVGQPPLTLGVVLKAGLNVASDQQVQALTRLISTGA